MTSVEEIKKQVEYYLSDENLKRDKFFNEEIRKSENGFIAIQLIMKCNKIKKLNITEQQLVDSVKDSEEVELDEAKTQIRRKGNKEVPELTEQQQNNNYGKLRDQNKPKEIEPYVFSFKSTQPEKISFARIQDKISEQYALKSVYTRFSQGQGNIIFDKSEAPEDQIQNLIKNGIEVDGFALTFEEAQGEKLNEFWDQHGDHYRFCLKSKLEKQQRQNKKDNNASNNKKGKKTRTSFNFNGEKWSNIDSLKNTFKQILTRATNDTPLSESYSSLLKELIQYHEKGAEKMENFKHFTVDIHPQYKDTRCFFVVKQDGTKVDFSAVKCIKNFEEKQQL